MLKQLIVWITLRMCPKYSLFKNSIGFGGENIFKTWIYFKHFALRTHWSEIWVSHSVIKITAFWVALKAGTASPCGALYCTVVLSSLKNPAFELCSSFRRNQQAGFVLLTHSWNIYRAGLAFWLKIANVIHRYSRHWFVRSFINFNTKV
jgi:hypothetical protein